MVMKDKLVKTNHKGSYYAMKRASIVLLAVASAAFFIAVPTYIIQSTKNKSTINLAEEKSSETENENSEESIKYESYND